MGDPLRDDSWTLPVGKGVTMSVLQNPLRTHAEATGEEAFVIPPHWHLYQDEEHVVLKGRIKLTQDGVTRIITPADGAVITRAGVVHSFEGFVGEELSLDEIARPSRLSTAEAARPSSETNEQKILFFRNLCAPGVMQSFLGTMQVFYYGDAYPAFPFKIRSLERLFVVVVGGWIAPLFGHKLGDNRLRMDLSRFPPSKKD
ncbi:hypothetical protein C8F04DRAFT_1073785 [Mycena alexandri]|uniref:Cupin type-2 domain-containing protein n=1 Tax=Mycena alexandri TaxID=1745969 RepID=A0AAD6TFV3_9AGAR|nr:hypothetical protein C8F04DRAFT_1073785 [Mycena alexandri]